jgi:hypothetical protein
MPIITIQRRHAELGRIRLGAKEGGKGRPMKLTAFRFTSTHERYITDLATLYGGEPRPWDNGGKPEFEVFTDATSIPVIAMKGGLSQWMETWSGGGCVHRCDGEQQVDGTICDPDDRAHQQAKPTTRLSLMLPELDAIGAWRLESHGWNAAAEIPAVAELAQFVGDLVPAHLNTMERRSIKDGKTSRYVVPVLDLQIGAARLREIVAQKSGTAAPALAAASSTAPALAAAPAINPFADYHVQVAAAADLDALGAVWDDARRDNLVGPDAANTPHAQAFVEAFTARAKTIKAAAPPTDPAPATQEPDADGAVDAEIVPDPPAGDEDAIWQQILTATGQQGMSLPDVEDDFSRQMGGLSSAEASAAELQAYLTKVTQPVPA